MYNVLLFQNLKCYICWFRNLTAAWIYNADVAALFKSTLIQFYKVLLLLLLIFMLLTSLEYSSQLENKILQIYIFLNLSVDKIKAMQLS